LATAAGVANVAELSDSFHSQRIRVRIVFRDDVRLELPHVGARRDEIVAEVVVDVARLAAVDERLFEQRHAEAPDHAAHELAVGG
jgi:hypothetical protein